jgi:hypothetical protein
MVLGFFDFLGFSSKRRTALQVFDRTLGNLEVNPAYVDDGMRFAIYKWAELLERQAGTSDAMDRIMREAAALISFCVLGAEETEALWGAEVRQEREARFMAAIKEENDDGFDARLVKLVLAKGIAAPDITARVELDQGS